MNPSFNKIFVFGFLLGYEFTERPFFALVYNNYLETEVRGESGLHKVDFDIIKKSVIYIICDKFLCSGARNIKATIDIRKILEK